MRVENIWQWEGRVDRGPTPRWDLGVRVEILAGLAGGHTAVSAALEPAELLASVRRDLQRA